MQIISSKFRWIFSKPFQIFSLRHFFKNKINENRLFNLFLRTFLSVEPLTPSEHNIWKYVLLKSISNILFYVFMLLFIIDCRTDSVRLCRPLYCLWRCSDSEILITFFSPFTLHKRNSEEKREWSAAPRKSSSQEQPSQLMAVLINGLIFELGSWHDIGSR